ncbi:MAG: PLP-dependent aminotransferase family protein [Rhodospirillaceae bacterium]|nr:PLP-dependent aminotransferase family protein [Rhodospirillaceae bacterium]
MTDWAPILERRKREIYLELAEKIADAIRSGALKPGAQLPTQRVMADRLGITVGTVGRAYMIVEQQGLISGEVGRGSFVRGPAAAVRSPKIEPAHENLIDLSVNAALTPFHGEALSRTLAELSRADGIDQLLRYMTTPWQAAYRAAAAEWLAQLGLAADPERIVLTNGAQHGIASAFAALLEPGEIALSEMLTYTGIIDDANRSGHALKGIVSDREGMRPDALDRAAVETGARVVFLQPTIHNPTCTTMSEARRRDIVAVARRRNLLLVEDDVYGMLPERRPPPLAALAPERTVYLSSASKAMGPGLRVGWIMAPENLVRRLDEARYSMTGSQPSIAFEIARRWIADGTAAEIMRRLRREMAARQSLAKTRLAGLAFDFDPAAFHIFLHLAEPWRREDFVQAALTHGVRIVSASAFIVGREVAPHAVRVSLAAARDHDTLDRALVILAELAQARPGVRRAVV